jgi:hypothetical protein
VNGGGMWRQRQWQDANGSGTRRQRLTRSQRAPGTAVEAENPSDSRENSQITY